MPPSSPTQRQVPLDTSRVLPVYEKKTAIGPVVGIIIILILLSFGALYFWGASMNREQEQLPFIPEDNSVQQAR